MRGWVLFRLSLIMPLMEVEFCTTEDTLHRALDENPADQGVRLVLADRLDELGDSDGAEALRWMAAKNRVPWAASDPPWSWGTWTAHYGKEGSPPDLSEIPTVLFNELTGGQHRFENIMEEYTGFCGRRWAEEALLGAWRLMQPEARAKFWAWNPGDEVR